VRSKCIILLGLLSMMAAPARGGSPTKAAAVKLDFARDVRPILANHCWACHGPDETSRAAGLRLDRRESALAALKDGKRAIVPGNLVDSALVQRIDHEKPSRRMPPLDFKKQITDAQRQVLKRWIAEGAEYAEHWAFVAPRRPELLAVKNKAWPINPIDHFILHRLESEGLTPSPPASKETLLRRVALDLTGLPPTLDDLDLYLKDTSANAYEKAVDRFLASPRYAEKMATSWLDAARYADTNGYNNDEERTMWPWRDWVINAFHKNMPFDQFLVEQLAGDLLPSATLEQKIATGFNRNHVFTTEGGIFEEEYRTEYVADRVHTTATVFLGMSLQCARCHEHKYDPISQKEYYEFFAFFNNVPDRTFGYNAKNIGEPFVKYAPPETLAALADLDKRLAERDGQIAKRESDAAERASMWEGRLTAEERRKISLAGQAFHLHLDEGEGTAVADERRGVKGTVKGARWTDGKFRKALEFDGTNHVDLYSHGSLSSDQPFSFSVWIYPATGEGTILSKISEKYQYRGYDLVVEEGGKLASHLVHRWPEDGLKVIAKNPISLNAWHHLVLTYDGSLKAGGVKLYLDGKAAPLDISKDQLKGSIGSSAPFHLGKRGESYPFKGKIDEVQLFHQELKSDDVAVLAADKALSTVVDVLALDAAQRTEPQKAQLRRYYLENIDAEFRRLKAERADLANQKAALEKTMVPTMVMQELPKRRDTYLLKRGQYDQRGDKVEPGVPRVFPRLPPNAPADRLALARWLVQPSHPLTARVTVNRWWAAYFGAGIVETVEDLGLQGDLPSHAELLDWLATELMRTGWDVKAMQKLIVTSATYRQLSKVTPDLLTKDPKNRLLARSPRSRLPAETVRDNALAISGLLKEKVGGPSVKPYQPPGLWEEVAVERRYKYVPDTGDGYYRRGMYTFWRRTCPPPGMTTFDAPDRETCVARRARTNTPLQALILLNDPTYVEAARVLAERMMKAGTTDDARMNFAFKLAVAREASTDERRILMALLKDSLTRYRADPAAAQKLLSTGPAGRDTAIPDVDLAAWTSVASMILNLDETISRP
jgi:hypothetical protein